MDTLTSWKLVNASIANEKDGISQFSGLDNGRLITVFTKPDRQECPENALWNIWERMRNKNSRIFMLKNPGPNDSNKKTGEVDANEEAFFSSTPWTGYGSRIGFGK